MKYVTTALREPLRLRTWREIAYLHITALWTGVSLVWLVITACLGVGLLIVLVGVPLLALLPLTARFCGEGHRRLTNRMLGEQVPSPLQFRPRRGFSGWLRSAFGFVDGWRAAAFAGLSAPVVAVGVWATWVIVPWATVAFTYPAWWLIGHPKKIDSHGVLHHSGISVGHFYFDTFWKSLIPFVVGLAALCALPWIVRGVTYVQRLLVRSLLGGGNLSERVRVLEASRAHAVQDAADTLRQLERDLHDGTQARLVSIAMQLGEAKEQLQQDDLSEGDLARLRELIHNSHVSSKEAIVEIRDVVRNVHPPVLDAGLNAATETLASRCAVPTSARVELVDRPGIVIESIAYFCVAELLTNVVKHSGARRAEVLIVQTGDRIDIAVTDDGHGGARSDHGTGLVGLGQRVATVDGSLDVNSPVGGPTVVRVSLPIRSSR